MKFFKIGISKLVLVSLVVFGFSGSLWGSYFMSEKQASKILQIENNYIQQQVYPVSQNSLNIDNLSSDDLIQLSHDLRVEGVLYEELFSQRFMYEKDALIKGHEVEFENFKTNSQEAISFTSTDILKLTWIFGKNSALAVADIYTRGVGSKAIALTKSSKYIWWAKEMHQLKKIGKFASIINSKKFKILVKILDTGFNLNDALEKMKIDSQNGETELVVTMEEFKSFLQDEGFLIKTYSSNSEKIIEFVDNSLAQDKIIPFLLEQIEVIIKEVSRSIYNKYIGSLEETPMEILKMFAIKGAEYTPILGSFINAIDETKEITAAHTQKLLSINDDYQVTLNNQREELWQLWDEYRINIIKTTIDLAHYNYPKEIFNDVKAYDWFFNYVNTLIEKKSITTKNRTFNPIANISQYEFLVISSKLFYINDFQIYKAQNQSTNNQKIYFDFINSKLGSISNIEYAKKNISITRAQVAEILHKLIYLKKKNSKLPYYADTSFSGKKSILFTLDKTYFGTMEPNKGWYYHSSFLRAINISNGYTNGNYGFNDNIKRSETAALLVGAYNFLEAN